MLGDSGLLGRNMFWGVRSNRTGSSSSHYLLCIPCRLGPLLEHKDLGFHNVWDLIYVPWLSALIQASRIRGLRFAVSMKWDPICFEEWNVLVAARYLCFSYLWSYCHLHILYFPWAEIPMLSKIATWMPAVGSPWDFHTVSGFHIYSPNLPWFRNWIRQEGKLPQEPQGKQWQSLVLWSTSWELEPSNRLIPSLPKNTWPMFSLNIQRRPDMFHSSGLQPAMRSCNLKQAVSIVQGEIYARKGVSIGEF